MKQYQCLTQQIDDAAHRLQTAAKDFVQDAYLWMWGDQLHTTRNEARHAAKRFHKRRSLSERALKAVQGYIRHKLGWAPVAMAAK